MQFTPYLNFNGDCETALRFYERVLGGKIETIMTHGESPIADQVPPAWHQQEKWSGPVVSSHGSPH